MELRVVPGWKNGSTGEGMAYFCGRKETQRTLFDVPSYSHSARQRRGEFHLASVTQPPQFYMEFVTFLSFERIKGEDWKLVEGVGTRI